MHGDAIWHFDHNKPPACYVCCEQYAKKHAHAYAFQLLFVFRLLHEGQRAFYAKFSGATVKTQFLLVRNFFPLTHPLLNIECFILNIDCIILNIFWHIFFCHSLLLCIGSDSSKCYMSGVLDVGHNCSKHKS